MEKRLILTYPLRCCGVSLKLNLPKVKDMLCLPIILCFITLSRMIGCSDVRYEKYVSRSYASVDFNFIGTPTEDWLKKTFGIIKRYIISFHRNETMFYTLTTGRSGVMGTGDLKRMFLHIL